MSASRRLLAGRSERTRKRIGSLVLDALPPGMLAVLPEHAWEEKIGDKALHFYCLGQLPLWRAQTLRTKEPETLEWIDAMGDGEVLWDIGANVGLYTIYAAAIRGLHVLAFEPVAANYFLLNRNVEINGLGDKVAAYCLALAGATKLGRLNLQSTDFGTALCNFGDNVDYKGRKFEPVFGQGMIGYTVDGFIEQFAPSFPNHIKIDVDGLEPRIVAGAIQTLSDRRLRSASIELDATAAAATQQVIEVLKSCGLVLQAKRRSELVSSGEHADLYNYHFRRGA